MSGSRIIWPAIRSDTPPPSGKFAAWDEGKGSGHERMLEELACKHRVYSSLIPETTFEIVE